MCARAFENKKNIYERFNNPHTLPPSRRRDLVYSCRSIASHRIQSVLTAQCAVRVYYFVGCLSNGTNRRRHFQFTIFMYTQIPNWKRIAHRAGTEQHNGAFCNEKFSMHRHPHRHAHNESTDKLLFNAQKCCSLVCCEMLCWARNDASQPTRDESSASSQ